MLNNNERQFEGVWIPKEIYLHKGLTPTEKLLLAEIKCFAKNGVCFASNEHFAEFLGISKKHVSRLLSKLASLSFITTELIYKEGTKEVDKRVITPIPIETDTPPHTGVYPMDIQGDTSPHESGDPLCVDAYYKVQDKIQDKEQDKIIKKINKKDKKNSSSAELESEFELLWEKYPRKIGKAKALQSYIKARKSKKYTFETIEIGLNKYLEYLKSNGTEAEFIAHFTTWLNQERFNDDLTYVSPTTKKKTQSFLDLYESKYGVEANAGTRNGTIIEYDTGLLS